jgi:hypothetical protein
VPNNDEVSPSEISDEKLNILASIEPSGIVLSNSILFIETDSKSIGSGRFVINPLSPSKYSVPSALLLEYCIFSDTFVFVRPKVSIHISRSETSTDWLQEQSLFLVKNSIYPVVIFAL